MIDIIIITKHVYNYTIRTMNTTFIILLFCKILLLYTKLKVSDTTYTYYY